MKYLLRTACLCLLVMLLGVSVVLAQGNCLALLEQALALANEQCAATGRNQVCFGYGMVNAQLQAGFEGLSFSQPGDTIDAAAIQSLESSSSDDQGSEWAVALMRLQLNMPDALPDKNVSILLLGDVSIENAIIAAPVPPPAPTLNVTAANQANVRGGPSTNDAVVGSLGAGDSLIGDGRNADASWIHIQLADGGSGWVFADLVTLDGDVNTLELVEETAGVEDAAPAAAPMSSFSFHSGGGSSACASQLPSGILVQSPDPEYPDPDALEGWIQVPPVLFSMNGAEILLGSTAFVEGQENGGADINVAEGYAQVTANGTSQFSRAGGTIDLPADDGSEAPTFAPDPDDAARLEPLVDLFHALEAAADLVPRPVDPEANKAEPGDDDWAEVFTENYQAGKLVVPEGYWVYMQSETSFNGFCPFNPSIFEPFIRYVTLDEVLEVDDLGIVTGVVTGEGVWPLTPSFPGWYVYSEVVEIVATQITIQVNSPLNISYNYVGDIDDGVLHCQTVTPRFLNSCLLDLAYGTTRGEGLCPEDIHKAMGTYGR